MLAGGAKGEVALSVAVEQGGCWCGTVALVGRGVDGGWAGRQGGLRAVREAAGLGLAGARLLRTHRGGSGGETARAIAVGGSGTPDDPFSVYVVGPTLSRDFPTTAGAFQQEISEATQKGKPGKNAPLADAFIAKIVGPHDGM